MAERDLDAMLRRMSQTKVNRRGFLAAAGLTGAAAALAACSRRHDQRRPERRRAVRRGLGRGVRCAVASASAAAAATARERAVHVQLGRVHRPGQHRGVQGRVRGRHFPYDVYGNNEELLAKLQGGASGYDIAAPTAEYVPGMVEEGFLQKLDVSRIPNLAVHQPDVQEACGGTRPTSTRSPRTTARPASCTAARLVPKAPRRRGASSTSYVKGEASGKTVFVDSMGDVFVFPLKMLGYSLNSVDQKPSSRRRARSCSTSPRTSSPSTPTSTATRSRPRRRPSTLGWTGPLGPGARDRRRPTDAGYVVPSEGTLFWLDTWVMLADAPHPNARTRGSTSSSGPRSRPRRRTTTCTRRRTTRPRSSSTRRSLTNPAIFPPDDVIANLEGAEDTSGNNQRIDIWEEFKQTIGG